MRKNTEKAIIMAMAEMADVGIPVDSFEPCEKDGEYDFVFSEELTSEQREKALQIVTKYLDGNWSF